MKVLFMAAPKSDIYAFNEYSRPSGGSNTEWIAYTDANQTAADKKVVEVYYSGSPDPAIRNLGTGADQIYIRGHNDNTLGTSVQVARGGTVLTAAEVSKRLIASGLRKNFAGKVKCYNCHSGEHFTGFKASFAQALADYLYNHGYTSCTFYGYEGALDSFYKTGSAGAHKYRRDKVTTGGSVTQVEGGRASDNRSQVKPKFNLAMQLGRIAGK